MDFNKLRKIATEKVNSRQLSPDCHVASVAAALVTDKGNVYIGVCIDTVCGMGFCAEHAAIAQMITNEESKIEKIVAIGENGKIYPPCGRCREFIFQIDNANFEAEVLVAEGVIVKIRDLLPYCSRLMTQE